MPSIPYYRDTNLSKKIIDLLYDSCRATSDYSAALSPHGTGSRTVTGASSSLALSFAASTPGSFRCSISRHVPHAG